MNDNYDVSFDAESNMWYATVYVEQEAPEEIGPFETREDAEKAVVHHLQHQ